MSASRLANHENVPKKCENLKCKDTNTDCVLLSGTAGLLMAHQLLLSNNETNVCVFEKENRLGGKIFDHRFPEVPNVTVGKFIVQK